MTARRPVGPPRHHSTGSVSEAVLSPKVLNFSRIVTRDTFSHRAALAWLPSAKAVELEPAFAQVLSTQLDPMFVMRASGQGGVLRQDRLRARTEG